MPDEDSLTMHMIDIEDVDAVMERPPVPSRPKALTDLEYWTIYSDYLQKAKPRDDLVWMRGVLHVFLRSLQRFMKKMTATYGPTCWETLLNESKHETRLAFVVDKLRRLGGSKNRNDAVDSLLGLKKNPLALPMPLGPMKRIWCKDYGVRFFVREATDLQRLLKSHHKKTRKAAAGGRQTGSGQRRRVIIDKNDRAGSSTVKFGDGSCDVYRNEAKMLSLLKGNGGFMAYKRLWKELYPKNVTYPDSPQGVPEKLKQIKCLLNKQLKEFLGAPPKDKFWVEPVKGQGYRLNLSVDWVFSGGRQPPADLTIVPGHLADYGLKESDRD